MIFNPSEVTFYVHLALYALHRHLTIPIQTVQNALATERVKSSKNIVYLLVSASERQVRVWGQSNKRNHSSRSANCTAEGRASKFSLKLTPQNEENYPQKWNTESYNLPMINIQIYQHTVFLVTFKTKNYVSFDTFI